MTEGVALGIITNIGLVIVAIIGKLDRKIISKKMDTVVHEVVSVKGDLGDVHSVVKEVKAQTDGIKDELVKSTAEASEMRGIAKGRLEQKQETQEKKIFVNCLDDDKDDLFMMEHTLKKLNITRYHLYSKREELLANMSTEANMYIIDHFLKGGATGLEVLREIVQRNPNNYIIICTGSTDARVLADYINEGIDKVLYKDDRNFNKNMEDYVTEGLRILLTRH